MIDMTAMDDNYFARLEENEAALEARQEYITKDAEKLIDDADVKTNVAETGYSLTDIVECYMNDLSEVVAALCNGTGEALIKKYVAEFAQKETA